MSDHILNLPPATQHTLDAGMTLALVATFFEWLPKATALLIFLYYVLVIVKMLREMRYRRLQHRRRKSDG